MSKRVKKFVFVLMVATVLSFVVNTPPASASVTPFGQCGTVPPHLPCWL